MIRFRQWIGVLVLAGTVAQAQTPPAAPSDVSDRTLTILKASPRPDAALIDAIEKTRAGPKVSPAASPQTLAPLFAASTTDAATLLKLFPLYSGAGDTAPAAALIAGAAKQAEIEASDPANVEALLTAIAQIQPAMNKFAWRTSGTLKPYGDLLAVYVDNCPPDKPQLAGKLADIQIRHITAARFGLTPEKALERMSAIDPKNLSREKDRDQLQYLQLEQLEQLSGRPNEVIDIATAVWAKPGHQFRNAAWRPLVDALHQSGRTAEAAAVLDEAAKVYPQAAAEIDQLRQKLKQPPASQPTAR